MKISTATLIFLEHCLVFAYASKSSLSFFPIGDWGGIDKPPYTTPVQVSISKAMALLAKQNPIDFILALGDNFYYKGVKDVEDPRFRITFEDVYCANSLQVPWFVVAGNHDYNGNVSAEVAYAKVSKRWKYPDLYYKKSFNIPNTDSIIDLVMIDTVLLCGILASDDLDVQPVLLEENKCMSEKHWIWIEDSLKQSKANYLLVAGHYPLYSIAKHGNTICLVERLLPLLQKYNVSAYISGHDHNIQHIQPKDSISKIDYFVSGCTNFIDPSTEHIDDIPKNSMKFHWADDKSFGAFAYAVATEKNITMQFIDSKGEILYEYSFHPRQF